ncbi:MAG: hypothetical protein QOD94_3118 [Alphaproteobacteria bacterium]|nr:hypothetical protein [Alphaproteobacteria bacterium]
MRILLYGAGKTGTTAVFYAYKNAVPNLATSFEPDELSKVNILNTPNLLVKSLAVMKYAREAQYFRYFDKKILIIRHPFDRLVSYVLYAPNNGHGFYNDAKMERYVDLLKNKLAAPGSVPFREIVERADSYRPSGSGAHAPVNVLAEIAEAHPDFHVLRYEDFVDGRLDELNRYNGFEVPSDPDISDRRQKVLRSKAYGDWHKWFLPEDVEYFKGIYRNYLNRFRYDTTLQSSEPLDEATTVAYSIKVNNQARRTRWLPEFRTGSVTLSEEGEQFQDTKRALLSGKLDKAEEMVDNLLATNPRVAGFHHLRSRIMARKGDYAQASEALRRAIAILPEEFEFHRLLSVALRKTGNKTEAAAAEAKARTLEGSSQKRRAM